ncbi:hypothetical protein PanWU01x14_125290, partial [Parasponia andersonii]
MSCGHARDNPECRRARITLRGLARDKCQVTRARVDFDDKHTRWHACGYEGGAKWHDYGYETSLHAD